MYREQERYGRDPRVVVRTSPATWRQPLARWGPRSTKGSPGAFRWAPGSFVFVDSWSDFFHEDSDSYRGEAWEVMRARPDLIFQVLTKRSDRIGDNLPKDWGDGWRNVWLGVSVEDASQVHRVQQLLQVPAALHFVSAEPLLGPVALQLEEHLGNWRDDGDERPRVGWVIVGGESGPTHGRRASRPMHPKWARDIRDACQAAGVLYMFKQWGRWGPGIRPRSPLDRRREWMTLPDGQHMKAAGKKANGRLLDGVLHDGMPEPTNLARCTACRQPPGALFGYEQGWGGPWPADNQCPQCEAPVAFLEAL